MVVSTLNFLFNGSVEVIAHTHTCPGKDSGVLVRTTDILQRTLFPIRELRQGRDQGKRLSQKLENSSNTRYQSFM